MFIVHVITRVAIFWVLFVNIDVSIFIIVSPNTPVNTYTSAMDNNLYQPRINAQKVVIIIYWIIVPPPPPPSDFVCSTAFPISTNIINNFIRVWKTNNAKSFLNLSLLSSSEFTPWTSFSCLHLCCTFSQNWLKQSERMLLAVLRTEIKTSLTQIGKEAKQHDNKLNETNQFWVIVALKNKHTIRMGPFRHLLLRHWYPF